MTEPIKNALIQFRVCPTCGKRITGVSKAFADPEEVFAWLDDDDLREDYEVLSLPCPACDPPDAERYATHLTLIVDGQEIGEPSEIGTMAIPVMADDPEKAHFDVVFDEEEGKAHDAANVAFTELPQSIFDPFVERYVRDTRFFGQVDAVLKAWPDWRWIAAFRELGLPEPEDGDYRKAARNDETIDRLLRWHIRRLTPPRIEIRGFRGT